MDLSLGENISAPVSNTDLCSPQISLRKNIFLHDCNLSLVPKTNQQVSVPESNQPAVYSCNPQFVMSEEH